MRKPWVNVSVVSIYPRLCFQWVGFKKDQCYNFCFCDMVSRWLTKICSITLRLFKFPIKQNWRQGQTWKHLKITQLRIQLLVCIRICGRILFLKIRTWVLTKGKQILRPSGCVLGLFSFLFIKICIQKAMTLGLNV